MKLVHINTTVLPFVKELVHLRFSRCYSIGVVNIQDSTRTLDTHIKLYRLGLLLLILLSLAISTVIGYLLYIAFPWIAGISILLALGTGFCCAFFWVFVCTRYESRQRALDDTTIKQTWVWGLEENEDFRETLKDVVARTRLVPS